MERTELEELQRRKRMQLVRLMEVLDLTDQLQQAVERRDQTSVRVLLSMRQTPIQELQEIENGIQGYLLTLPEEDAIRCNELLQGAAAEMADEALVCEQVEKYRRTLEKVIAADKRLSVGLGGPRSFYKKFPGSV